MKRIYVALLAVAAALSLGTGAWSSTIGYPGSTTLTYDLNAVGRAITVQDLPQGGPTGQLSQCNITTQGVFVATLTASTSRQPDFSSPTTVATITGPGTTQVALPAYPVQDFGIRVEATSYTSGHPLVAIDCGGGTLVMAGVPLINAGGGAVNSVAAGNSLVNVSPTAGSVVVTPTLGPSFTSLTIPSLASAPCLGTNSSGTMTSAACPSPGPFNAGTCIGIVASPAPATINYTCASPTPAASPIAGSNVTVSGSYPFTIAATTPTPAPTPSPHAAGNIAFSGSYPYTATVTTPSPAATGCGVVSGSWPYTIDTTSCGAGSVHAKLSIGLGFVAGALSTSAIYPYQQVVGYTSGEITAIRVACGTTDNGTSSFTLTDVTASATVGTVTMSNGTSVASTTLGSPYALTTGHVLHLTDTVAGTATSCGLVAEGQQLAF